MSPRRRADEGSLTQEQRPRKLLRTTAPSHSANDIVVVQVGEPSTSRAEAYHRGRPPAHNTLPLESLFDVYKRIQRYAPEYRPLVSTRPPVGDGYLKISKLGNFPELAFSHSQPSQRVGYRNESAAHHEEYCQNLQQRPLFEMRAAQVSPIKVVHQGQKEESDMDVQVLPLQKMPRGLGSSYSTSLNSQDHYLEHYFYQAFCPGRTIKSRNNAWLHYIMPIQDLEMVVRGRRCLSALYVNDLTTARSVEHLRMKNIMVQDEMQIFERLRDIQKQSLNPGPLDRDTATELLAISPIMIQFDIVNFEREAMVTLPTKPLRSYLIEFVIELLRTGKIHVGDPELRNLEPSPPAKPTVEHFDNIPKGWNNVQFWPATLQSTLMIARHSILSQPMEDLRSKRFDFKREQNKFDWLLRVTLSEAYQIDPRLGFSRRLLHYIHSITYLAHGMLTGHKWRWPKVASSYLQALREMRQWSKEYTTELTAKNNSQPIERIRSLHANYTTESPAEMTSWTAEAWRLAIIAYCQCRLFRLPRNHPDVVATLEDLHHCIRVQPTKGDLFTTEAPLYPVFLLGLLSIPENPHHRSTSQTWMTRVTANSERSTAKPLHTALEKIWTWIDKDQVFTPLEPSALHPEIWMRPAWWESLVHTISREENRLLCLT